MDRSREKVELLPRVKVPKVTPQPKSISDLPAKNLSDALRGFELAPNYGSSKILFDEKEEKMLSGPRLPPDATNGKSFEPSINLWDMLREYEGSIRDDSQKRGSGTRIEEHKGEELHDGPQPQHDTNSNSKISIFENSTSSKPPLVYVDGEKWPCK